MGWARPMCRWRSFPPAPQTLWAENWGFPPLSIGRRRLFPVGAMPGGSGQGNLGHARSTPAAVLSCGCGRRVRRSRHQQARCGLEASRGGDRLCGVGAAADLRVRLSQFQCAVNGTKVSTTFAVVQRSLRYAGWLRLARSTGLRHPHLACCLFNGRSPARYLIYALAIVTRTHHWLGDVSLLEGETVVCASEDSAGSIDFEVDGELAGRLPVRFDVVPDALTLLVPRRFLH